MTDSAPLIPPTVIHAAYVLAAAIGGIGGTFIALTKLMPERARMIMGYQVEAITNLQAENQRLINENTHLRKRLNTLEKRMGKLERESRPASL